MVTNDRLPIGNEIFADVSYFVRGNPLLSTAILGTTLTGITAGVVAVRSRKKKRKTTTRKRRSTRKRISARTKRVGRRRKVSHSSPRHRGHKFVTFTTKDGKRVKFKVQKKNHTHAKRRRN